jgi:hypothetical protein
LSHIGHDYDDDDETYPTNTGSTKQDTDTGSSITEDQPIAQEPQNEPFNEEFDLKYYRTNYALK